jgi:SAM-dependent methyltransferase
MRGQRLWWCVILVGVLALPAVGGAGAAPSLSAREPSPPGAREVPYVPTPQEVVEAMLRAAQVGPEDVLYDLGCGDGRIVVMAARQFGARATGVELDPERLSEAQANAHRAGVTGRVRFLQQDLFTTELRDATVVTLYLLPAVNLRLRPRLLRDLQPGARVVSHAFDMGEWPPDRVVQVSRRTIYLWVVPAQVGGTWVWQPAGASTSQPYRLRLRQHFQRLSGSLQAGGRETPVTDSELRGRALRFTVRPEVEGQPVRMVFQGRVEGDLVAGHVHIDDAATPEMQPWQARRESAEGLLLYTALVR